MRPLTLLPARTRHEDPAHPFVGALDRYGLRLDIEQNAGDTRSGVSPEGKPWTCTLAAAYGEVADTVGADGDPVDVFVGDEPHAPYVYVIQAKLPGSRKFDETKSCLCFRTQEEAVAAFRASYSAPGFFRGVTRWTVPAWRHAMLERPDVHGGQMTTPLAKGLRLLISLEKAQQLLIQPRMEATTQTHAPYRVHCPVQLTTSGLGPRRWRCVDHEHHDDRHPLERAEARQFMREIAERGGELHATAARMERPELRRLAAEGLIDVASNPKHYNYEHRVVLTKRGRDVYGKWLAEHDQRAQAAQTTLIPAPPRTDGS